MTDRDHRILDAAIEVFSRYGMRKATMGDIAEQAGVSRQTLYARHSNKDDIMAAAMKLIAERVCQEVTQGWGSAQDIGDRLDVFLDCAVVRFFDQIRRMPDASDLLSGHGDSAKAARIAAENGKLALLSDMFAPYAEALAVRGSSPGELAEFFYATASSFNFTARDEAHLSRLLATLKQSTLTMLGEA